MEGEFKAIMTIVICGTIIIVSIIAAITIYNVWG